MDAAADYAAAKLALATHLPAYVSYTATTHSKFDAIVQDAHANVVVRTSDGTVLKGAGGGHAPYVQIGGDKPGDEEPLTDPAFKPGCYVATGARAETFEGKGVEAIALRDTCAKSKEDKDFDTLYVDPATHRPVAAVGTDNDENVAVRLEQHFTAVGDAVLPASLYVRVHGSGLMSWLDVLYDRRYSDYRFSSTEP
jgi:hypothetical protein